MVKTARGTLSSRQAVPSIGSPFAAALMVRWAGRSVYLRTLRSQLLRTPRRTRLISTVRRLVVSQRETHSARIALSGSTLAARRAGI